MITVIMPAYNSERTIAASIESVFSQTYVGWRLIVVDDCSSDATASIAAEFARRDARVRVIRNETNLGVSASRNKAIALAESEWIAFLDSDDLWDAAKLEKQLALAEKTGAEFLFTGSAFIDESGEPYSGAAEAPFSLTYRQLRNRNKISCSSVLVKKKFFDGSNPIRMERDDIHEDYAVWLKILKRGTVAYGVNEPLLIYRLAKNSRSGNKFNTVKKTFGVFRLVGINPVGAAYFTVRNLIGAVKKYSRIK